MRIPLDELDEVPSLTTQPLDGASCLSHETSYLDDPKKALRAYFDREGIDPAPQFEFVDQPRSLATGSRSGLMCTIQ
ncbi:unnamed protein product [Protopolystoma xenopodis]|uniref:Uncharacterized protein n=1 Tax=Protopolystoma xenopodis TaxID=117903 RepID=A0A448X095_9PLAT|nr:unnamed protein product [Protopolystoma xenopodis]